MSDFTYTLLPGGGSGSINDGGNAAITVTPGNLLKVLWNTQLAGTFGVPVFSTDLPVQPSVTPSGITTLVGGLSVAYGIALLSFGWGGAETGIVPAGLYNLALAFGDGTNNQTCSFTITVAAATGQPVAVGAPVVNINYPAMTGNAWSFAAGVPVTFQLAATNLPTTWNAAQIPPGLSIDNNGNVTGTVFAPGNYQLIVVAGNANGNSAPQNFAINITAATGTAPVAVSIPWLDPSQIDLQTLLNLRRVTSSMLGSVAGFTEGEDLQFAVLPMMGSNVITSGISALSMTIRPTGNFNCQPMVQQAGATTPTAVTFPIFVASSSTSSPTVTVSSIPANLVVGSALLGSTIAPGGIVGTTITLNANASTALTNASTTFTTPAQQYYALSFKLESPRIQEWFAEANAAPAGGNSVTAIASQGVLQFTYNSKVYITEPFPFTIFQNIAAPDEW